MGRKSGGSSLYEWRLWDKSSERSVKGETIELPSVTTIIGAILAKQLDVWTQNMTLDLLAAGLNASRERDMIEVDDFLDGEVLSEWMRDNEITLGHWMKMRGQEGHDHHDYFEKLGVESVIDRGAALRRAQKDSNRQDVEGAMARWWMTHDPEVLAPEQTLRWFSGRGPSPLGFAGTLDLAYVAQDGARVIVDLKTRNSKGGVWDSDRAQVGGLKLAYEQHKGIPVDRLEVFVAREDGKQVTEIVDASTWTPNFLSLFEIYERSRR